MVGRRGDLPWLCHCHSGVLPSWLLTTISQSQTVRPTSKHALPRHHPTHLPGKGPFLVLPGTGASQLQPRDDSGSTPECHSENKGNVLRFTRNLGESRRERRGSGRMGGLGAEVTNTSRRLRQEKHSLIGTPPII